MSDFDWDAAIDKARTGWTTGAIQASNGSECVVGILASVSGMKMGYGTTLTQDAIEFVAKSHPEAIEALYQVLIEQEPKIVETIQDDQEEFVWGNADEPLHVMASYLVTWNDYHCPGGERLASYLEKAKVL